MKTIVALLVGGVMFGTIAPVLAQTPPRPDVPQAAVLRDRYQIGLMESILQRAAEHGAKVTRDRARMVVSGDMLLSEEVRVRGIRLAGYGVFFYISRGGYWYRARSYRGPFRVCEVRYVPRAILNVPGRYWRHPHGGPPGQLKKRENVVVVREADERGHGNGHGNNGHGKHGN